MKLKEGIALFIMTMSAIGMWCMYVVKMQQVEMVREFNTIQPMDLTVTYCQACSACNTKDELDAIEFENCLQKDLDALETAKDQLDKNAKKGEKACLL